MMIRMLFIAGILVSAVSFGCGPEKDAKKVTSQPVRTTQAKVTPMAKTVAQETQAVSSIRDLSSSDTTPAETSVGTAEE